MNVGGFGLRIKKNGIFLIMVEATSATAAVAIVDVAAAPNISKRVEVTPRPESNWYILLGCFSFLCFDSRSIRCCSSNCSIIRVISVRVLIFELIAFWRFFTSSILGIGRLLILGVGDLLCWIVVVNKRFTISIICI